MSLETFIEFTQALAILNKPLAAEQLAALNKYVATYIQESEKNKVIIDPFNLLGILNSFNMMKNYQDVQVWDYSLHYILHREGDSEINSNIFYHYLYVLYCHIKRLNVKLKSIPKL